MKRGLIILVFGLIAAAAAYGCIYLTCTASARNMQRSDKPELAWLKEEFNLSDAEFKQVAVSRASDIAREAADIILMKSEIEAVPEALGLARATLRTIKQNLFWAFFYNALAVPLAATGFMSPILCAAAMGLSDTIVIGNALRLRNWRRL
jgi:hypothetical protein